MGVYLTYSYDNTKRSRMIDNLTLRLRRDEGQIKKAKEYGLLVGAGLVGGKIIVPKAVLWKIAPAPITGLIYFWKDDPGGNQ